MKVSRAVSFLLGSMVVFMASASDRALAATWHQDFTTNGGVAAADWNIETGGGGWGNNELQTYTSSSANLTQSGGILNIIALKPTSTTYTSARINTKNKRSFGAYGTMKARIQGPNGKGLWPAFWMLGSNIDSAVWPGCGEIDIMEHVNNDANALGTIHWNNPGWVYYTAMNAATSFTSYHVYGINWTSSAITWTIDGASKGSANILNNVNGTEEFHKAFFVILNVAVGGNLPGSPDASTVFPKKMLVDYVYWN